MGRQRRTTWLNHYIVKLKNGIVFLQRGGIISNFTRFALSCKVQKKKFIFRSFVLEVVPKLHQEDRFPIG